MAKRLTHSSLGLPKSGLKGWLLALVFGSVALSGVCAATSDVAGADTRSLNNGQLILQQVPEIPASLAQRLLSTARTSPTAVESLSTARAGPTTPN